MRPITVQVFASHPVVRTQYGRVLSAEKNLRLVKGEDGSEVGVFDGELTSLDAVLTLELLRFPSMKPLLLSSSCGEEDCLRWMLRGVRGLVCYERYEEQLCSAVRCLAEGQLWFARSVVSQWLRIINSQALPSFLSPLTSRERNVFSLVCRRLSNKQIAAALGISVRTAKFHVGNVLAKLKVSSRTELSAYALRDLHLRGLPLAPVPFPVPQTS